MHAMFNRFWQWLCQAFVSLDMVGLTLGTLLFTFSLTPSLLPRPIVIQGLLSGLSFSAGYGLGVVWQWLWNYLHFPIVPARFSRIVTRVASGFCVILMIAFLWQASLWQNSIRVLMGMDKLTTAHPLQLGATAFVVFVVLLVLVRLFLRVLDFVSKGLQRFLQPRAAKLMGFIVCLWLVWSIAEGVLVRSVLRTVDRSFQQLDAMIEDNLPIPENSSQTGSQDSLVNWKDLGRQGRRFVANGPTSADLSKFFGVACPAPIRVYVGLNSVDTPEGRARLALQELIRVGGFQRSVMLLATPTGTGWIDPASQDTVEYLHRGDIATVTAQYSYLNSPLALLTDAEYGREMAGALFTEIYSYWRSLPKDSRPRLFLDGLSLGSFNSDLSFQLYDIIDDPFDGALWSGPPFLQPTWRHVTRQRAAGSPAWLPEFREGTVVRFMNQQGTFHGDAKPWGAFRIAFLQHASDPITFFEPASAWRQPDWMREPRGPDVSAHLRWFPIVTMLQLAADMMMGNAPPGFGHNYAPEQYMAAWLGLTEPDDWNPSDLERLHQLFGNQVQP